MRWAVSGSPDVVRSTLYSAFGIRKIATVYTPSTTTP
jgi:hypothetical protein